MGRSRTLLGTVPTLLRTSRELVRALDGWADEEHLSRNTLAWRILAGEVLKHDQSGATHKTSNADKQ